MDCLRANKNSSIIWHSLLFWALVFIRRVHLKGSADYHMAHWLPVLEQLVPPCQHLWSQKPFHLLHFPLVRKDEKGLCISFVIHPQHWAGQVFVMKVPVVVLVLKHHRYFDWSTLIHIKVFELILRGVKWFLPPTWREEGEMVSVDLQPGNASPTVTQTPSAHVISVSL